MNLLHLVIGCAALGYTGVFVWRLQVEWFDEPSGIDHPYRGYFRALLWPIFWGRP